VGVEEEVEEEVVEDLEHLDLTFLVERVAMDQAERFRFLGLVNTKFYIYLAIYI